jgi:hypothetical protein
MRVSSGVVDQNIENNPVQRKEPHENKGLHQDGRFARKNLLTRRANHRHNYILPQFSKTPTTAPMKAVRPRLQDKSFQQLKLHRLAGG